EGSLKDTLRDSLTLDDWGLELTTPEQRARDLVHLLAAKDDQRETWKGNLRKYRWNEPALRIPEALAKQASSKGELTVEQVVDYSHRHHAYLNLTASQVFIDDPTQSAALRAAAKLNWDAAPTLAYMVDTLSDGKAELAYVIVAALDPAKEPPLGPFS